MEAAAPLAVAVPVVVAAVLVAVGAHASRALADGAALAGALATAVLCALLLAHVWDGTEVYWFGGWHPRAGGVALGIDFAVDALGAGAATFVSVLVSAAMLYSSRYSKAVPPLYHGLMLIFLAGMVGLTLTGDLFNLFVFFELMSVPAYALTGYQIEERGPLQGALNFAITNSFGAFLTLSGIGLLYGRTGALNMAQVGSALAGGETDGLVIVAFVLVISGFLVKAATVPFHFWLDDAHAVAPVPVCVLFSGIMVQLGLFAMARVYWTVFSGQSGMHDPGLVAVLVALGVLTALVGAAMSILQRHLKRLLAFSTISHSGMFLVGLAVLEPHGMTGAAIFVAAHGLTKASLFMVTGILGHRLGSVDEWVLHGRGRELPVFGVVFLAGGLALASLPPFGPFLGKSLVDEAAAASGHAWIAIAFLVASALAAGAVLRAGARIFLGLGDPLERTPGSPDQGAVAQEATDDEPETVGPHGRVPAVMAVPAVVLALAGPAIAFIPDLTGGVDHAAARFQAREVYTAQVLYGHDRPLARSAPPSGPHRSAYLYGLGSLAGALAVAGLGLYGGRLRRWMPVAAQAGARAGVTALRGWHSGHVGDYVTWLVVGIAALGWTLGLVLANAP